MAEILKQFFFANSLANEIAQVPQRVQREFEREQYRSELLVTGVQLVIIALLAVPNASVPPSYSPDAPVNAAPLGLTLFAVMALLRLYFAVTGQLTRWMLGFSVVGETAILMFVIWAYHLQYEQAPQFYLKSTQFVYVFILIGLRALRFEPIWVMLSGATAIISWLILLGYALMTAPSNPITWDYVTALKSIQIRYGGEFDKILAIAVVTAVLALALTRARRMLVKAVSGEHAVADLSLFFDDSVAKRITQSEAEVMAGQGELRSAAILFLDMRGFTEASAILGPTELIKLLGEHQGLMVPIVKRYGGNIDKFMGDGILASFGAVTPDSRYAANALNAVDEIMATADQWRTQRTNAGLAAPGVGAGLATGEIVFGIIGEGNRLEYTVIGDAVNLAAKLEKHNKVEKTRGLTTRVAYELAVSQGYRGNKETRSARQVGGVSEPLDLAVLSRYLANGAIGNGSQETVG